MSVFRIQALLILAILAILPGCRRPTLAEQDAQERMDPAIQAAWAASETGGLAAAETLYDAIILKRPDSPRAHLDLAMLLMTADEKPVKAIYHFMRFLELRPESQSKEMIGRNIRLLTVMISSKASRSRISQLEQQVATLQAENEALRLGTPFVPARPATPAIGFPAPAAPAPVTVGPTVPAPVAPAPSAPARPRVYTVVAGDTLSKIAQKMYGDGTKTERIYQANRGKLRSENSLQAGQTLIVPP